MLSSIVGGVSVPRDLFRPCGVGAYAPHTFLLPARNRWNKEADVLFAGHRDPAYKFLAGLGLHKQQNVLSFVGARRLMTRAEPRPWGLPLNGRLA